ncbi:hypothetical protein [Bradyrhizobium sp. Leo170]|uniref:hypothetical protein n=1 Tax=Bradyrhizobium sp. Leo170 TaxID=1571199 RepID=UPI00102E5C78|nr:hypothetical protein [Bradyrhizobium sp. Leo170]
MFKLFVELEVLRKGTGKALFPWATHLKKYSGKATQDEQAAEDGHKHRPSVRPAIVSANNGEPSAEQENA